MPESKDSHENLALVTGGSSGIGKAIAHKLLENNYKIIVVDILPSTDAQINFKKCDISQGKEVDELFAWTQNHHQIPSVLILNAGQGIREKLTEGDPEKWQRVFDSNVMGSLRCIRAFVPAMLKHKKKGHVVFISSVAAHQPHPFGGVYSASKTALETIAETLRQETLPHLKVTIIAPGITDTAFFDNEISGAVSIQDFDSAALSAEDIADDVWYAINKPFKHSINRITTRPTDQKF